MGFYKIPKLKDFGLLKEHLTFKVNCVLFWARVSLYSPWLSWSWLYKPGLPQTHRYVQASVCGVLGLKAQVSTSVKVLNILMAVGVPKLYCKFNCYISKRSGGTRKGHTLLCQGDMSLGTFSTVNWYSKAQSTVSGTTLRQVGPGCIRKVAEQTSNQCFSTDCLSSCPNSFSDGPLPGSRRMKQTLSSPGRFWSWCLSQQHKENSDTTRCHGV